MMNNLADTKLPVMGTIRARLPELLSILFARISERHLTVVQLPCRVKTRDAACIDIKLLSSILARMEFNIELLCRP